MKDFEVLGPVRTLLVRTHFIDARLEAAVRGGATQVVILGAGFDTRAYRFAELLKDSSVFEVDHPSTQELKIQKVREAVGETPANLRYTPADLRQDSLGGALAQGGYRADRKTFFIWEGVTMYLPEEAVVATLRWIAAHSAPGSCLVFDYAYRAMVQGIGNIDVDKVPEQWKQAVMRFKRLTAGEPWIFGLPDRGEEEFLRGVGLKLRRIMGMNSAEAIERYLTRQDGTILGNIPATEQQAYLILEAEVA